MCDAGLGVLSFSDFPPHPVHHVHLLESIRMCILKESNLRVSKSSSRGFFFWLLLFLNFNSIHIVKQNQEANAPHDKRKRKPYPVSKEINHTKIIFFPLLLWALLLMVSYGRIVRRSSVYQTMLVCAKHLSEWSCEKAIC